MLWFWVGLWLDWGWVGLGLVWFGFALGLVWFALGCYDFDLVCFGLAENLDEKKTLPCNSQTLWKYKLLRF